MHFVVTGGAGFIGSHLIDRLLAGGNVITVIDDLSTGSAANMPHHMNLRFVNKPIGECQAKDISGPVDGIAHLAATASVGESWERPLQTDLNNVSATLSVIELCRELKVPRVVFASSAAVYGAAHHPPLTETSAINPVSPYGLQKLTSERYLAMFAEAAGFSSISLRLFNVFGPRQRADSEYSGVISKFAAALANDCPIDIFGDGGQTRDFVYVSDVAAAFESALSYRLAPTHSQVFNIGTGTPTSIVEMVERLGQAWGKTPVQVVYRPPRVGDIRHSYADINAACEVLGYWPAYSLSSGLATLLNWLAAGHPLTSNSRSEQ